MIPYDLDPSLHSAQPQAQTLDDGFAPPVHETDHRTAEAPPATGTEVKLPEKSAF